MVAIEPFTKEEIEEGAGYYLHCSHCEKPIGFVSIVTEPSFHDRSSLTKWRFYCEPCGFELNKQMHDTMAEKEGRMWESLK